QGKHAQAEPLFRKALQIRQTVQGELLDDTATCYNNLAYNLHSQRQYPAAAQAWQHAARSFEAARLRASAAGLDRALFAAARTSPSSPPAPTQARAGSPADAWQPLEQPLGRGLLDELSVRQLRPLRPEEEQHRQEWDRQLAQLGPQILALVARKDATDDDRRR